MFLIFIGTIQFANGRKLTAMTRLKFQLFCVQGEYNSGEIVFEDSVGNLRNFDGLLMTSSRTYKTQSLLNSLSKTPDPIHIVIFSNVISSKSNMLMF